MPLGGYCVQCGRWVWLTSYGECQNGHPPASVKDVQQLKPQPTDVVVTSVEPPSAPRARFRWWWRHSLWIGWTFSLGFLNWVSFVYIGIKARKAPWTALGFVYLIPLVLTILAWGTPLLALMIALQLVVSAGSFVNALYLRPHYRAIMFGDTPQAALPAPPQPPPLLTAGERPALPKGMDEGAADVLQPARRQVDAILQSAGSITKPAIRDEVIALCRTADQIIAELASRPRKLDAARGFLTYYLDAAQRIVDGYVYLNGRSSTSPDITRTLARAEDSLHVVQQAFDRQLANVLEDRALDLDSEIELLERTVRTETMYTQTGELT